MKIGRNDPCWCGSGKKYKACHAAFDEKIESYKAKRIPVPSHKLIKTPEQLEGIRKAGKLNTAVLDMIAEKICAGMSTEDINTLAHNYIVEHGGIPACLGYQGFPKSICTSVNDVVCHGIPSEDEILQDGDIINVDVTTILDGYYADASRMFMIGEVSGAAGIAHWMNAHFKLVGDEKIEKQDELVLRVKAEVDREYAEGRTTSFGDEELEQIIRELDPERFFKLTHIMPM